MRGPMPGRANGGGRGPLPYGGTLREPQDAGATRAPARINGGSSCPGWTGVAVFTGVVMGWAMLGPASAYALGADSRLQVAVLDYEGGDARDRPNALRRLAQEMIRRTSVDMSMEAVALRPVDPKLALYPMLFATGSAAMKPLTMAEVTAMQRYLRGGGLIVGDAAGEDFARTFRNEMSRVAVGAPFEPLPVSHVLFKTFYLLDTAAGRMLNKPYLEALMFDGRAAIILSHNDLAGAWSRDNFGNWEFDVSPGGERQREMSFRYGVNLIMYALCLDYKDDQVHLPFLKKRRR